MQVVQKKNCKNAKNEDWKLSDHKKLGSEAKIIAALKANQPLEPKNVCKAAGISLSTFYRNYRVLERNKLVKKIGNKYALWEYEETPSYWELVQGRMLAAGGRPIKLEVEKLRLGEQDPITGWYRKIFDKKIVVEGVVIPKAAKELMEAAKINIEDEYSAALITKGPVDLGDRFTWQEYICIVWNKETIYEGNDISYNILYLKTAWNG
jgi:hypothetical protein